MRTRYVIDTNVLIAASAVDPASVAARFATPDDPELRHRVHAWLTALQQSPTRMVLDGDQKILEEYEGSLGFNDYGRQVVIDKMSTSAVDWVEVLYDDDGSGYLDEPLAGIVHDRSDRKMVAAAVAAIETYGECALANASDTDWYDWEEALIEAGVFVEQIIGEWSRQKWRDKHPS